MSPPALQSTSGRYGCFHPDIPAVGAVPTSKKPLLQPQQPADFIPQLLGQSPALFTSRGAMPTKSLPDLRPGAPAGCPASQPGTIGSDEDNLLLVRDKAPDFLDHYLRYTQSIQRADSVRYLYLYHYGGLYTDLDNECLQPFEHVLFSQPFNYSHTRQAASQINKSIADYQSLSNCSVLLSSMRRSGRPGRRPYVENSLMFARRRGHPFWLTVLEAMAERAR
uniref:Glycosyltransferase family 92 protein n=1 Tax=Macrostomum lignano TaxID=282301 RepID=A0A1I8H9W2_9PLAT